MILAALLLAGQLAAPADGKAHRLTFNASETSGVELAIHVPEGYDPKQPRPLILALHPGAARMPAYGQLFLLQVVQPAARDLGAIVIAPDCPSRAWTDRDTETTVVALVKAAMAEYAIDPRRVLVVGFSMGGRGAWAMSARHSDLFTGAIPIAAAPTDAPWAGAIPTYVIHSRDDQVSPFAPAEKAAQQLAANGKAVHFEALSGPDHYGMGAYVEAIRRGIEWVVERWK